MEIFEIENPEIMSQKEKLEKYKEIIEDTEDFLLESHIRKSKSKSKKLKDFQNFIKDMNQIGLNLSNISIFDQKNKLQIKSKIQQNKFYTNFYFQKDGDLIFSYHGESKDFYTKDGKQSILFTIIKLKDQEASYIGTVNQNGLFDGYDILQKSQTIKKQITSIISSNKF